MNAETTRRQQEAELRWQCRDQMSARQLYEHARAGEFAVGEEAADPALMQPLPVQFVEPEGEFLEKTVVWIVAAVAVVAILAAVIPAF